MTEVVQVYIMRAAGGVSYAGYFETIANELASFQKIVGGHVEVVALTDEIDLVVNDEGKLRGLSLNRVCVDDNNEVLDILVGDILAVRHCGEEFVDIKEEDVAEINKILKPLIDGMIILDSDFELPKYNG